MCSKVESPGGSWDGSDPKTLGGLRQRSHAAFGFRVSYSMKPSSSSTRYLAERVPRDMLRALVLALGQHHQHELSLVALLGERHQYPARVDAPGMSVDLHRRASCIRMVCTTVGRGPWPLNSLAGKCRAAVHRGPLGACRHKRVELLVTGVLPIRPNS